MYLIHKLGEGSFSEIKPRVVPINILIRLAIEQINSGKPVTAKTINEILAYCNIRITDQDIKIFN